MPPSSTPSPTTDATGPAPDPHYSGHRDRLRARLMSAGDDALADYEVLEVLLFAARPRQDVKPLAKQLIEQFGSLGAVLEAPPEQLVGRAGLKPTTIAQLRIVKVAAERMLGERLRERPIIGAWRHLLDYLAVAMKYDRVEHVRLLFLDRKNRLIADEVTQTGTVDHTPLYPREIVRRALQLDASAIILVHNHPSGDPTPSRADIEMTREVDRACKALSITLHDHLIVGAGEPTSFKALGLL